MERSSLICRKVLQEVLERNLDHSVIETNVAMLQKKLAKERV